MWKIYHKSFPDREILDFSHLWYSMVTQVFSCDFPSVPGFSAVLENAELGARGVLPAGTSLRWGSFLNIVLIPTSYIYIMSWWMLFQKFWGSMIVIFHFILKRAES
jgi:hypothetical protein